MFGAQKILRICCTPLLLCDGSKVFIEAIRPLPFQDSVLNEVIIDDTAMENPEAFRRRVLHLADKWPEIERVVDAAMSAQYGRGRDGRARENGDNWNGRGYYERLGAHRVRSSLSLPVINIDARPITTARSGLIAPICAPRAVLLIAVRTFTPGEIAGAST